VPCGRQNEPAIFHAGFEWAHAATLRALQPDRQAFNRRTIGYPFPRFRGRRHPLRERRGTVTWKTV
jgi:hypothetical protein